MRGYLMKRRFLTSMILIVSLLTSCATSKPLRDSRYPLEYDAALRALADNLFIQVNNQLQNDITRKFSKQLFVIDPFIDENTAEVTETSNDVEAALQEAGKNASNKFIISPMTPKNIGEANYVVNGIFRLDSYGKGESGKESRYYHLSSNVVDLKTGLVVATAEAWVSNKQLKHTPVGVYRESPMYLKDSSAASVAATTRVPVGTKVDKSYLDQMSVTALLTEADQLLDKGDLEGALAIYQRTEELGESGRTMKTYAGMYQCYRKLGKAKEAELAFGKLTEQGFKNRNMSVKLMFEVNSTQFMPELRSQYGVWLKQIARFFGSSGYCLTIVGHSSKSGSEAYNDALSLKRALAVQKIMRNDFPQMLQRSKAVGKGFQENIVGSGTDDAQDAI